LPHKITVTVTEATEESAGAFEIRSLMEGMERLVVTGTKSAPSVTATISSRDHTLSAKEALYYGSMLMLAGAIADVDNAETIVGTATWDHYHDDIIRLADSVFELVIAGLRRRIHSFGDKHVEVLKVDEDREVKRIVIVQDTELCRVTHYQPCGTAFHAAQALARIIRQLEEKRGAAA